MAIKKTTKKAMRKTYPSSAKKTAPKPRMKRITVEELATVMAENHAKTEAAIRELSAENEKTLIAVKEAGIRTDKSIAKIQEAIDRLDDGFGGISKRLGDLTEIIVIPKIRIYINKLGNHNFEDTIADKTVVAVVGGTKEPIAEIDALLLGDGEAMAVEIKAHLKKTKVDTHLKRLQKLRTYEKEVGIAGKKLFGAVVGVVVDNDAREHAKKNGLYVVKIREEEDNLEIEKPDTRRTW